jgi:hypothetical protein
MKDKFWIFLAVTAILVILVLFILSGRNDAAYCKSFTYDSCPENCAVCPPCVVCSSVSCQTEEFCESIGFNKSWSEGIRERLKQLN